MADSDHNPLDVARAYRALGADRWPEDKKVALGLHLLGIDPARFEDEPDGPG